jgi:hypothetical protein
MRPRATGRFTAIRAGLTNYWPLNESVPSGDVTATNWVAGGLNMTSNNSVLSTTGIIGNARTFVSANSEQMSGNAGASTTLFGTSNYTCAFWFRMTSAFVSGNQGLVSSDFFPTERGVSIYMTGSGGQWFPPYMNINYADASSETYAAFATNAAVSAWHFFCVRLSAGTTLDVRFNASDATPKTITKAFHASRQRLFFGLRTTGTTDYLNGDLDEVAMWNRRLSDAEVSTLYNSGAGIDLRQ